MRIQPDTRTAFFLGLSLAANAFAVHAQPAASSAASVTLPAGSDLRLALDRDSRLHKVGQPVTAILTQPLYAGETLAAPIGTRAEGHVTRIGAGPKGEHVSRLLKGDLTPVRAADVAIDTLVLADGTRVPVTTVPSQGVDGVHEARFVPKGQKPGSKAQIGAAFKPLQAPHKLERLNKTLLTALPYHPNYLNAGSVYDEVLVNDVRLQLPAAPAPASLDTSAPGDPLMRLKLVSGLDSASSEFATKVTAEVTEPFYDASHVLLYPVGSRLEGKVTRARGAGWLKKNGALSFNFTSITRPGRQAVPFTATLVALEVAGGQDLAVSSEGDLRATNSRFKEGLALSGLVLPSLGVADSSNIKTVVPRFGAGDRGFGLLGAGAAQSAGNVAIGFGYYGAAKGVYGAFISRGRDVVLPVNTPLAVRVEGGSSGSAGPTVASLR